MTEVRLPALVLDAAFATTLDDGLYLFSRSPSPDEVGAPRLTPIVLSIEEIANSPAGVDAASIVVTVNGETAWSGGAAGSGWSGSVGPSWFWETGLKVSLQRATAFASSDEVSVSVQASTVGGGADLDETWTFTVEDYHSPRLLSALATGLRTVRLTFDEPIQATAPTAVFVATSVPAAPVSMLSATVDGSTLVVELDDDASPAALYSVTVGGIYDLTGNAIGDDDTAVFAGFVPAKPTTRRFDLWSMLPRANRREDALSSGDMARFVACLQEIVDLQLADIDGLFDVWDIDRCPARFLDLVLADLGNPFESFDLADATKRRLAGVLIDIYRAKGTAAGIVNAIQFLIGITVTVTANRFVGPGLGTAVIGTTWRLGSSDRRTLYSFRVISPVILTDAQRDQVRMIAEYMKPAHTHLTAIVEPTSPVLLTSWVLGRARLGVNTQLQ